MNEKQQQLLFDKGITNVPSDALCSDNALEESLGMVYDNGEHRVIQKPELHISSLGTSGTIPTILYIHKHEGKKRYIGYSVSAIVSGSTTIPANTFVWGVKSSSSLIEIKSLGITRSGNEKITSVGKTLVISSNTGPLRYFIWQDNSTYSQPIANIPPIKLSAELTHTGILSNTIKIGDIFGETKFTTNILEQNQEEYNNVVVGLYSQNLKEIAHKKRFARPFFVCAALELFDGTYTMMSQPILMPVTVTDNVYGSIWLTPSSSSGYAYETYGRALKLTTGYAELSCKQDTDYSKYSEIVKDVVIFVTDGISIYDTAGDQSITKKGAGSVLIDIMNERQIKQTKQQPYPTGTYQANFNVLSKREHNDINDDVKGASRFYRICSIGVSPRALSSVSGLMNSYTLETLTSQQMLVGADYFGNSPLCAEMLFSYNSRLNISGVSRDIFPGFSFFMPFGEDIDGCKITVEIKTDTGNKIAVVNNVTIPKKTGFWFFYPDSRATKVVIHQGETKIFSHKLEEHSGLNGAYCFLGFPQTTGETPTSDGTTISSSDNTPERLTSYILTSEADNPYVFKAEGYYRIGSGSVLAMSTTTQALSQGQFGQYPLLAFTDDGIWALNVANTGYYSAIHPMSREVCNNSKSITQTDGAVFFTSNKGLMVVVGSQVKCVSEQMSGRTNCFSHNQFVPVRYLGNFNEYLENAIMAYDYRDSLLWIFNPSYLYCYVYSIKSGVFGRFSTVQSVTNVVNNYPDYLLQKYNDSNKVFSLLDRKDINKDEEIYNNLWLFTRPMKLENSLAMKSIMQVLHIKDFKPYTVEETTTDPETHQETTTKVTKQGAIVMRLFASNNLTNWVELKSLRGTPWKYYRMNIKFEGLKATDRYSGTVIVTQERRTDKLR